MVNSFYTAIGGAGFVFILPRPPPLRIPEFFRERIILSRIPSKTTEVWFDTEGKFVEGRL
jgi:hypothetical protein